MVVDANIAFKCLAAQRGDLRDRLGPPANLKFYSPRFLFVELFKHKERLGRATQLSEEELLGSIAVNLSGTHSPLFSCPLPQIFKMRIAARLGSSVDTIVTYRLQCAGDGEGDQEAGASERTRPV